MYLHKFPLRIKYQDFYVDAMNGTHLVQKYLKSQLTLFHSLDPILNIDLRNQLYTIDCLDIYGELLSVALMWNKAELKKKQLGSNSLFTFSSDTGLITFTPCRDDQFRFFMNEVGAMDAIHMKVLI